MSAVVAGFAAASPVAGVLCRYDLIVPADDSTGELGGQFALAPEALAEITMDVRMLAPSNEYATCPAQQFVDVLDFAYADASTVSLSISCSMVWQGDVHAILTGQLADETEALLAGVSSPSESSPTVVSASTS